MNSKKREKPYYSSSSSSSSRHAPYSKRRRPLPLDAVPDSIDDGSSSTFAAAKLPTSVVVIGVPAECSVLDLKSRFEMYGAISRTRMEPSGVAYINFRSNDAAQSAVDAATDSSFPVTLHSVPVQVMWATNPVPQWSRGVGRKDGLASKLVKPEVPLSRHGRGNKLGSAIVNPRDDENNSNNQANDAGNNDDKIDGAGRATGNSDTGSAFKGREIVAYDDIL